jgi:flagellar biosynthesis protein FlhB
MASNQTEKATPRRREKAKEEGQVLRSRELTSSLSLLATIIFMGWQPLGFLTPWRSLFVSGLDAASRSDLGSVSFLLSSTVLLVAKWAFPIAAVAWMASIAVSFAQGGVVIAPKALAPNLKRLNPVTNLGNLFSIAGFSRLLKSLVPFVVVLYFSGSILIREWSHVVHASSLSTRPFMVFAYGRLFEIAWKSCFIMLLWSVIDYFLQRLQHEKSMRMSKQEVKQESKDSEGNPEIRMRIRRLRRELRRRWMLKDVKNATVVITNPNHYAVALQYDPESMKAPLIIAKGQNLIAQKIKEFARWNEIPIVENKPLAQALYKTVEVGQSIPGNLYVGVAEILAFVYRAQARMQARSAPVSSMPPMPGSVPSRSS